jgi:hypothetical protein
MHRILAVLGISCAIVALGGCKGGPPRYPNDVTAVLKTDPTKSYGQQTIAVSVALCSDELPPPHIQNKTQLEEWFNKESNEKKNLKTQRRLYTFSLDTGKGGVEKKFSHNWLDKKYKEDQHPSVVVIANLMNSEPTANLLSLPLEPEKMTYEFVILPDGVKPAGVKPAGE